MKEKKYFKPNCSLTLNEATFYNYNETIDRPV